MKRLYCVHLLGPDNVYAVASRDDAFRIAKEWGDWLDNDARFGPRDGDDMVLLEPLPSLWDGTPEHHAKQLEKIGADWRAWEV